MTLHSEEQCKRNLGHFTDVISACEDRLKSLLHTDVKSIQLREESHREMLSTFQSHVETESGPTQAHIVQCLQYWQQLQKELTACNNSQIGLRLKSRQLKEREQVQEQRTILTREQLKQCRLEQEYSTSYSYSTLITVAFTITAIMYIIATVDRGREEQQLKNRNIQNTVPIMSKSETQILSERLAEEEKQRDMEQLKERLTESQAELAKASSDLGKIKADKEKLETHFIEREKQIKKLTDEREDIYEKYKAAIKYGQQIATDKKKLEQQQQDMTARLHTSKDEKSKLVNEITSSQERVTKTSEELMAQEQANETLKNHVKALDTKIDRQGKSIQKRELKIESLNKELKNQERRISEQNKKDLKREVDLKLKNEEIQQIKTELSKQKHRLQKTEQEMQDLQEKHLTMKEDCAELDAAVLQKDFELDKEVEKRQRVYEQLAHKENQIKRLERELQDHSTSSRKSKHTPSLKLKTDTEIRAELHEEFEVRYNRFETKTHDQITSLTETVGHLRIDLREQRIELQKAQSLNKRLQELLDHNHAQTRREKAKEAKDRTYRVKLDVSLSAPLSTQ